VFLRLTNPFDSHVHWLATGQQATTLKLHHLRKVDDVTHLQVQPMHFAGAWLTGFGWDQNRWPGADFPTRQILDRVFTDTPVCFTRADGHAIWVNSQALRVAGLLDRTVADPQGGLIVRDAAGAAIGVLLDTAMDLVRSHIPQPQSAVIRAALLAGMHDFNARGFTHIRDLSCDAHQWSEVVKLDREGLLTLAVEQFFDAENPDDAERVIQLIIEARREPLRSVRVKGLKIFYDGALGSEGALLSCAYCSGSGHGLQLMSRERLSEILQQAWRQQLEVAVHAIGDEANHQIASVATQLWRAGHTGLLHIEHAQMLRPETIALLTSQSVQCHMQPCHWLSDRLWLKDKIPTLMPHLFRWADLERAHIHFDFGSDSPIEESSLANTLKALTESAPDIASPQHPGWHYHQHPDSDWIPHCYSEFAQASESESPQVTPQHVWYSGRQIF
jgi:predicted amidohydrolase YtcJ